MTPGVKAVSLDDHHDRVWILGTRSMYKSIVIVKPKYTQYVCTV
jgi:hypothetical protein